MGEEDGQEQLLGDTRWPGVLLVVFALCVLCGVAAALRFFF